MAKTKAPEETINLQRQSGSNLTALKNDISKLANEVISLKAKRAEVNAEIAECRAKAKRMGIKPKAFDLAIAYREMDAEQRENFDESYAIAREANGVPFKAQLDLFDQERDEDERGNPDKGGAKPDVKNGPGTEQFDIEQHLGEQALKDGLPETLGGQA
jgi:chorismate mutase